MASSLTRRPELWRQFSAGAQALFIGQQTSLLQHAIYDRVDLCWYLQSVVRQKGDSALAPIWLMAETDESGRNAERFLRAFWDISERYIHWQIIDDVADFADDCLHGIRGAPAFVLMAQGEYASHVLAQLASGKTVAESEVLQKLRRCIWLEPLRPCGSGLGPLFAEEIARSTLVNCKAELVLPLEQLSNLRWNQANTLKEALLTDRAEAVRIIRASCVLCRILACARPHCVNGQHGCAHCKQTT
ncbi:MAG: hypothetical protein H0U76_04995 [Ktedonobacteraceae bacterium]|nr:hypothetical protein [Ktedonobacteraceae bacterium]